MIFFDDIDLLKCIQKVEGDCYKEITEVQGNIYGAGGFNRYFVNRVLYGEKRFENFEPWEVVFSEFHSTVGGVNKAKEAGFRIFS